MATAETNPKPIRVKVEYHFENKSHKFNTVPEKPILKKGAYVEFYSDDPGATVEVLLDPSRAFQPNHYKTGGRPVLVTESFGNGTIWCGGTYPLPAVDPHHPPPPIRIDPSERQFGSHSTDI